MFRFIDVLRGLAQCGIITRILALEPQVKFSAELMQNDANSAKPMRHTRYFERSICSKGLGCGEVKNFMPPWDASPLLPKTQTSELMS